MSGDVITTNTAAYSLHFFPYLSMTALQLIRLRMLNAQSLYGTLVVFQIIIIIITALAVWGNGKAKCWINLSSVKKLSNV